MYWLCCWPWKPAKQVPESETWGIQQCYSITGGPSSSCEKIILHNNSHGWIVRVCIRMFTTALRNKTIRKILNENNSPYFHSVSLVIWPFTLMKSTHCIRKAQAWTLHFRTPNPRSEKSQCKTVSLTWVVWVYSSICSWRLTSPRYYIYFDYFRAKKWYTARCSIVTTTRGTQLVYPTIPFRGMNLYDHSGWQRSHKRICSFRKNPGCAQNISHLTAWNETWKQKFLVWNPDLRQNQVQYPRFFASKAIEKTSTIIGEMFRRKSQKRGNWIVNYCLATGLGCCKAWVIANY